jgi:hypothetical protein
LASGVSEIIFGEAPRSCYFLMRCHVLGRSFPQAETRLLIAIGSANRSLIGAPVVRPALPYWQERNRRLHG